MRIQLRRELVEERENEADGSVYCCGLGYGAECQTWDRLQLRNNLTAIQALTGIGVTTVVVVRAPCLNLKFKLFRQVACLESCPFVSVFPTSRTPPSRARARHCY